MEANTPYALYDNDGKRAMQWAAHIRLTPELLLKLQQNPEQVLLTLNANLSGGDSGGAARKSTKKTSLLSVNMGASAPAAAGEGDGNESEGSSALVARYELHSFKEDPRVNYLAMFRQDHAQSQVPGADQSGGHADANESIGIKRSSSSKGGYSVYTTGKIYQKLIVQRMLDSTEKDRMKDRHAQSVIESRSRASKLLEDHPPAANKRKRVSLFSTQFAKPDAKSVLSVDAPARKRSICLMRAAAALSAFMNSILPSVLSAEDAQRTKERIQKGFEKKIIPPPVAAAAPAAAVAEFLSNQQGTAKANAKAAKATGKQAAQASLFSSDSESEGGDDDNDGEESKKQEESNGEAADQATGKLPAKEKTSDGANEIEHRSDAAPTAATASAEDSTQQIITQATSQKQPQPKPRKPPVVSETKRPLPRASRIPDLSFFPREVGLICKKTSAHITRTVVLDEEDYDTFVQQYESFKADWETLDKAYSIEMINIEGLHVRLRFAADDQERAGLEREQQENARKKEALLFVRDAMASIQKILSSIQVSIARYDRKQSQ